MAYLYNLLALIGIWTIANAASAPSTNYTIKVEVTFEVEVQEEDGQSMEPLGTFVIGLFTETCPMTTLNFRKLASGYERGGRDLKYKKTPIHRIVPDFLIQMGDITVGDGTGGTSIYGDKFNDENFILSHKAAGYVSMANHGRDTNGSQFFILLTKSRWLDGKHVVFGKVVKGIDIVKKIGDIPASSSTAVPKRKVRISDCKVADVKEYTLTEKESSSEDDVKK